MFNSGRGKGRAGGLGTPLDYPKGGYDDYGRAEWETPETIRDSLLFDQYAR